MLIAVTGSSGTIGKELIKTITNRKHNFLQMNRGDLDINKENERRKKLIKKSKSESEKFKLEALEGSYEKTVRELRTQEMNIYIVNQEKFPDILTRIESIVNADPDNDQFRVVYAQMLESSDMDKALKEYKKTLESNPNNLTANYNLGAHYMNIGVEYSQLANALPMSEEKKYEEYIESRDKMYKSSLPYLEKAHELEPSNKSILSVLQQLCGQLGDMEGYKKYKEKLDSLGG